MEFLSKMKSEDIKQNNLTMCPQKNKAQGPRD